MGGCQVDRLYYQNIFEKAEFRLTTSHCETDRQLLHQEQTISKLRVPTCSINGQQSNGTEFWWLLMSTAERTSGRQ